MTRSFRSNGDIGGRSRTTARPNIDSIRCRPVWPNARWMISQGNWLVLLVFGGVMGCDPGPTQVPSATHSPTPAPSATTVSSETTSASPVVPVATGPTEADVRAAMRKLVDADRQLRRSIRDVADATTAQRALPALEAGSRGVTEAANEFRRLLDAASQDLPLGQIVVDYGQEIHELGKELPERAIDKMATPDVVQVWGDFRPFREMLEAMNALQQSISARLSEGDSALAEHRMRAEADMSRFRESAKRWVGNRLGAGTAPGVPPGFPPPGPSSGAAPDRDQRPRLDEPPRQNVIVVTRGTDGRWIPVMVREVLADGQVGVVVMNRVDGKLVPGERKTVAASELHRAIPQLDLPGQ